MTKKKDIHGAIEGYVNIVKGISYTENKPVLELSFSTHYSPNQRVVVIDEKCAENLSQKLKEILTLKNE